ncbi:MAG: hypothetical protein F4087_07165 [Gemmatimonadetes bacterium]|nr:hypothetical protein [Gemmatimonadota bacterium]MYA10184.1 hypothetical protein [Gemmatimonadota bacterium]MYD12830.1 hypothetical protein [Gemmatimonadota bacterium]MYE69831.1 hypothetical protein [Gemmatimonadota bacterium]MYI64847.1 hypothetical protein [Gemmatimonadota bacterium]
MNTATIGRAGFRLLAAGTILSAGAACVSYRQVGVDELGSQQSVRLQLTAEELARHLSFADVNRRTVSGRFVELQGDSAIFVLTTPVAHQQVSLPLTSIVVAERRDPDHVRSILLSSAVVGGVATLAYLGFEGNQNTDPDGPGEVVDQFAPVFRLVIPFGR